jgi:hypothetical protein
VEVMETGADVRSAGIATATRVEWRVFLRLGMMIRFCDDCDNRKVTSLCFAFMMPGSG